VARESGAILTKVRWTQAATGDLKAISWRVAERSNLATANRVCRTIYDAIQILGKFPRSGKSGIEEGTRELVVAALPSYIVVYRVAEGESVQILRIWHGAQQRSSAD
jgi:toxin ParE1/3/4